MADKDYNMDEGGCATFSGKVATKDVERFLSKDGPEGVNVETGWDSKTRYTGKSNDA